MQNRYYGRTEEDKFVLYVTEKKTHGFFVDLGSKHPIHENPTFLLEKDYQWKGIYAPATELSLSSPLLQERRCNVSPLPTPTDYKSWFQGNEIPPHVDFLNINLNVDDGTAKHTIEVFDRDIFTEHQFTVVVFRHDIYRTNEKQTRDIARNIMKKHGYLLAIENMASINNMDVYQDWYVLGSRVDRDQIENLRRKNEKSYQYNRISGPSINYMFVEYPPASAS